MLCLNSHSSFDCHCAFCVNVIMLVFKYYILLVMLPFLMSFHSFRLFFGIVYIFSARFCKTYFISSKSTMMRASQKRIQPRSRDVTQVLKSSLSPSSRILASPVSRSALSEPSVFPSSSHMFESFCSLITKMFRWKKYLFQWLCHWQQIQDSWSQWQIMLFSPSGVHCYLYQDHTSRRGILWWDCSWEGL